MKKKIIIRVISSVLILSAIALNVNTFADIPDNNFTLSQIVSNTNANAEIGGQTYEDKFYFVIGLDPTFWVCCEEDVTDGCWTSMWPICP